MEVVVLATVVEVAVHAEVVELDGSVTWVFGDGSGTCLSVVENDDPERVLGNMHVVGSCTQSLSDLTGSRSLDVVVHVRSSVIGT